MSVFHYVKNLSFFFFKKENQMDLKFRSFIGRYRINQEPERRKEKGEIKTKDKRKKTKVKGKKEIGQSPPFGGLGGKK
jgi:hypothetical protein